MIDCECIHPLYTDFEHLRQRKVGNKSTSDMMICNLVQGGNQNDPNENYQIPFSKFAFETT